MKLFRTLPILALVLAAQVRPASAAANKEHLQLMAEIRMLQEQNQQLQQLLGSLQDTLKTVTTKIDDQSAAMRKAMADQTLAVNNIGDNVRVLREKTDETNVRISTVGQEVETLRQAIASQPAPAAAVNPTGGDPAAPPLAGGTTPTAPPPTTPSTVSPQRMYQTSLDDYSAGRYQLAIDGFENFIHTFPRLPQAADAQYNIGMSFFNQSNWAEARDAFQKVVADYPQGAAQTLADAYYKLGATFERLAQNDNAKRAYDTVIQRYPTTSTATLAQQALLRLTKK